MVVFCSGRLKLGCSINLWRVKSSSCVGECLCDQRNETEVMALSEHEVNCCSFWPVRLGCENNLLPRPVPASRTRLKTLMELMRSLRTRDAPSCFHAEEQQLGCIPVRRKVLDSRERPLGNLVKFVRTFADRLPEPPLPGQARLGSVAAAPAGHRDSTEDAEVPSLGCGLRGSGVSVLEFMSIS